MRSGSVAAHIRSLALRRVWWVLLLPLVQLIAAAHLISHVEVNGSADPDPQAGLHLSQCDVCPAALAALGGGTPMEPASLRLPRLDQMPGLEPLIAWVLPSADRPYLSRAPPVFSS